jgi:tyrosine-protein kinase Etk/Wzc
VAQNISCSAAAALNSLEFIEEQLPIAERAVTEAQNALNAYRQQQQSVDVDYETRTLLEHATNIEAVNHPTYQALLQNRAAFEAQLEEIRKATLSLPET